MKNILSFFQLFFYFNSPSYFLKVVTAGMFEMHCDEIIRTLTKRAENVRSRLLTKMLQDHQVANKQLCDEYEAIAEKALTSPSNTEHLMELRSYIQQIQNDTMFDLESRLVNTKERLSFLVDFVTLSPADVRMNNSVFQWHQRMPEVFGEHQKIVDANRAQYENALKSRRERFIEDLDGYAKQVDEFQTFGEMAEINRYLKKAQALQNRLDVAGEKVCHLFKFFVSFDYFCLSLKGIISTKQKKNFLVFLKIKM